MVLFDATLQVTVEDSTDIKQGNISNKLELFRAHTPHTLCQSVAHLLLGEHVQ